MNAITRNVKDTKRGKHLIEFFDDQLVVSLSNAKLLCGYSVNSGNDVILDKVSKCNVIVRVSFSKKGIRNEKYYITILGFKEMYSKMTQKDKKQNLKLAYDMIKEAYHEECAFRSEQVMEKLYEETDSNSPAPQECSSLNSEEIAEEIKSIVGIDYFKSKQRWIKLYDELDKSLEESIRQTHQRYKTNNNCNISLLNFIKYNTKLLPLLHDTALKLFN